MDQVQILNELSREIRGIIDNYEKSYAAASGPVKRQGICTPKTAKYIQQYCRYAILIYGDAVLNIERRLEQVAK